MTTKLDPYNLETEKLLSAADFTLARVLEIGSGDGRLAFRCAKISSFVVGLEPDFEQLRKARMNRSIEGKELMFLQADGMQLPFRENTFDIVVLGWSL